MPTYEYECAKCGTVFDLFQPITEPARRRLKKSDPHPCDCKAQVKRRIGTGAGVIFKGSGFYQTDYRSESYRKAAKAEKEAGSKKPVEKKPADKKAGDGKGEKVKPSTPKKSTDANG